ALGDLKAVAALPALLELLRRGDDHTRYMLAKSFRALGTPALEPLLGLLGDRDAGVRRWAVFSLGVLGRRQALEGLVAALADPEQGSAGSARKPGPETAGGRDQYPVAAPRRGGMKSIRLTITLPTATLEEFDRLLVAEGETRSSVVRRLILQAIRDADRSDE